MPAWLMFKLISLSYSGALKYHTTDPIESVKNNCDYVHHKDQVMEALAHFRHLKKEELEFVTKAATLSGVAVIGVFSWSETETTFWAAKMLWHWSFFLSIFALIGSAHQRLLRHLPDDKFQDHFDENKIKLALNLFLSPPVRPKAPDHKVSVAGQGSRQVSYRMVWMWQCPVMLMSYSWVLFLVGYALHVLKPVFDPGQRELSRTVRSIKPLAD